MTIKNSTRSIVKMAVVIQLFALAILATFRSGELLSYTYDLPTNVVSEKIVIAAEGWNGLMESVGTARIGDRAVKIVSNLRNEEEF